LPSAPAIAVTSAEISWKLVIRLCITLLYVLLSWTASGNVPSPLFPPVPVATLVTVARTVMAASSATMVSSVVRICFW
jgi:hypothetical protein